MKIMAFDRFDEASKGPWGSARLLWGFLSVPVAALVAGVVFGVLEMRETRRGGGGVWKGSSLARLACGLDEVARGRLRDAGEEGRLGEEARVLRVRLEGTGLVLRTEGGR